MSRFPLSLSSKMCENVKMSHFIMNAKYQLYLVMVHFFLLFLGGQWRILFLHFLWKCIFTVQCTLKVCFQYGQSESCCCCYICYIAHVFLYLITSPQTLLGPTQSLQNCSTGFERIDYYFWKTLPCLGFLLFLFFFFFESLRTGNSWPLHYH